jgi:butyryl-CoA dehydrogenase
MTQQELALERKMLADSVRKWVQRTCGPAQSAASSATQGMGATRHWDEFAEMGWLAIGLPEQDGGLGGELADLCIVAEELGRALVAEPFVSCVVLGGMLMADLADGDMRSEWLPALAEGRRRLAFAPWDAGNGGLGGTTAVPHGAGWRLDGHKLLTPGLDDADGCIVRADMGGAACGLFLVQCDAPGVQRQPVSLYDGRRAAALALCGAAGALLLDGPAVAVHARVRSAMDRALVVHCAETIGTMLMAFEITRDYLAARKQFGRPLAANQVIRHRLVDLYVEIEEVRSLCGVAAHEPAPRLVAALAARSAEAARHVWEEAIQLHGAIGMTEEYVLGAYVRRLALASSVYGGVHEHLSRLADLSLTQN